MLLYISTLVPPPFTLLPHHGILVQINCVLVLCKIYAIGGSKYVGVTEVADVRRDAWRTSSQDSRRDLSWDWRRDSERNSGRHACWDATADSRDYSFWSFFCSSSTERSTLFWYGQGLAGCTPMLAVSSAQLNALSIEAFWMFEVLYSQWVRERWMALFRYQQCLTVN